MALSGSVSLTSSKAWRGRITWSATQNIGGNYSDVYVYAGMWKTDGYATSSNSYTSGTITIDGETYDLIGYQEFKNEVCIFEDTIRIYHDSDGSKSFSISLTCKGQANTSLSGSTLSGSGTFTLDQIPRTSSFAATDAAIGSVSTITIYRESSSLHHRIKAEFGSVTGYVTNTGGFSSTAATITGTSVAFTIPNDFYYAIPNAKKGTCKLTLYTLSGGTVIGGEVTTEIEITTVSSRCNPTLTITMTHDNADTAELTGSNTAYIRGYSDAKCTIVATGRYGATIKTVWTTGNYTKNEDGTYTISPVNSDTITFYAQDSRGYTGQVSTTITLVPYIVLTNNASAGRPNPTDGSAFIQFQGQYFNDSFGAVDNTLSLKYKIEYPDGSIDESWTTVTPALSKDSYDAYISLSGFDYNKSFKIYTVVTDKLLTIERTVILKQGIPVFDWGKHDFQFHVPVYIQGHLVDVPEVLFTSEDSIGEKGNVTLSEDVSNFEYLEVFFNDNNGRGCDSVKIYNPEGKQFAPVAVEPNSGRAMYFRRSGYTISGKEIAYAGNGGYAYFNGSTWTTYTGNYIRITRVLGHNRTTVAAVSNVYAALAAMTMTKTEPTESSSSEQISYEMDYAPEETFPKD